MASPRPVRIPRVRTGAESPGGAGGAPARPYAVELRPNRNAARRSARVATLFLTAMAVLYGALVAFDRLAPGGTRPSATSGLELFSAIAVVIATAGALLSLSNAPRAVEVRPEATYVVGRFGTRREFPPLGELRTRLLRRYRAGLLSPGPVDVVELSGPHGTRTYLLDPGLVEDGGPVG